MGYGIDERGLPTAGEFWKFELGPFDQVPHSIKRPVPVVGKKAIDQVVFPDVAFLDSPTGNLHRYLRGKGLLLGERGRKVPCVGRIVFRMIRVDVALMR
ncbi:MAG: hypothetical protein V3W22_00735, partial [Thermoplasmata archaeon]